MMSILLFDPSSEMQCTSSYTDRPLLRNALAINENENCLSTSTWNDRGDEAGSVGRWTVAKLAPRKTHVKCYDRTHIQKS
jgi:hypothetical protein